MLWLLKCTSHLSNHKIQQFFEVRSDKERQRTQSVVCFVANVPSINKKEKCPKRSCLEL